ncbi:histone H3.v1-like [Tigriopus californicus]|uniref:histone H3.v1-like n=1 Tax=Tigriopus californicus TaxID=6832 RepID=UPI0027D9EEE5|nr:histone H3.v1-like [Tigriopus californicus]
MVEEQDGNQDREEEQQGEGEHEEEDQEQHGEGDQEEQDKLLVQDEFADHHQQQEPECQRTEPRNEGSKPLMTTRSRSTAKRDDPNLCVSEGPAQSGLNDPKNRQVLGRGGPTRGDDLGSLDLSTRLFDSVNDNEECPGDSSVLDDLGYCDNLEEGEQ